MLGRIAAALERTVAFQEQSEIREVRLLAMTEQATRFTTEAAQSMRQQFERPDTAMPADGDVIRFTVRNGETPQDAVVRVLGEQADQ